MNKLSRLEGISRAVVIHDSVGLEAGCEKNKKWEGCVLAGESGHQF